MSFDCFFSLRFASVSNIIHFVLMIRWALKNADIYSFRLPRVTKPKQKSVNFLSETGLPTEMNTAI